MKAGLGLNALLISSKSPKKRIEGIDLLKALAAAEDDQAQYNLGELFYDGKLLPKNYGAAFHWHKRSADQGNALAAYNVGLEYCQGEGTEKDAEKGYVYMLIAAAVGASPGQLPKFSSQDLEQLKNIPQLLSELETGLSKD